MKKLKVIVSVTNDLYTDQRVHKVCSFLHENGYDVLLVGRKLKNSKDIDGRPYKTYRFRLPFTKGAFFYMSYNLRLFWFLIFRRCDVLVSNDLDTLLANYCAHKLKRKSRLVYDSHELFTEVPELISRPKVRNFWLAIEKRIFPKLDTIITVNKSIAHIYAKKYHKDLYVVRNVSRQWKPSQLLSKKELNLPEDKYIIILQGAGINVDRGAEEAVMAMRYIDNALFLIVGSGDVIPELKKLVERENLLEKVLFTGRVPYEQMMNYTYHADIGLTLDKDTNPNYRYSLPNKVFDYIHTGTPVISSDLIELRRVIETHHVGKIIPSHEPKDIALTIRSLIDNPIVLQEMKENCKEAAEIENWETECEVLKKIYL
ncbi:MAG: glycosyltransferase family 4 protein [Brumimicrobium sp.]|nr:glycosyltransferase family 4 protein [Brumimicrobium sp.]MCO5269544.1 glycosyltransferase family 4 protein [Brumimicrobium sp.]